MTVRLMVSSQQHHLMEKDEIEILMIGGWRRPGQRILDVHRAAGAARLLALAVPAVLATALRVVVVAEGLARMLARVRAPAAAVNAPHESAQAANGKVGDAMVATRRVGVVGLVHPAVGAKAAPGLRSGAGDEPIT